jgi:UDP-N-acetylmuramoylalanine--D-glutamate ligase
LDGGNIVLNLRRKQVIFKLSEFREDRPHQISNILAVILVCRLFHVPRKRILAACMGGVTREHRIQNVGEAGNVSFVNDSKATNIASALAACACFRGPIHLLLGGITKGQNFDELFAKIPKNVDKVFAFGAGAGEICDAAQRANFESISKYAGLKEATVAAYKHGFGPRVVLLSPACSSFDEFENYGHRGKVFAELVREIANDRN